MRYYKSTQKSNATLLVPGLTLCLHMRNMLLSKDSKLTPELNCCSYDSKIPKDINLCYLGLVLFLLTFNLLKCMATISCPVLCYIVY